ncbi:MAG: glycosyltransferase [Bacteroidetes bacterium]|nr:glycosyltransferase [Bacteroidota bacterium]
MESGKILVSVIIPVRNGIDTLERCLNGLLRQTVADRMEIIVIDSGSTDGTLELLAKYPVKVHPIDPKTFNHGETRNLGVQLARGEFVFMTVQDASPADDKVLELMISHFDDPLVAGVCGQQIVPHERGKNPLQWFRPASEATPFSYHFANPEEFARMPGHEQHKYCNWDDVVAMYRRETKLKVPFRKLMFSEDTLWAKDALLAGYKIVYDYRARVYHYHHQDYKFYFKRSYIILYQNYKFYNYIKFPSNPFTKALRIIVRLARMNELSLAEKLRWMRYNLTLLRAAWAAALIFWYNARLRGINGVEASQKKYVGFPPQGVQAKKS